MSHINRCYPGLFDYPAQFLKERHPCRHIQGAHWLVQEENLRPENHSSSQTDPLAFTPGEGTSAPLGQMPNPKESKSLLDPDLHFFVRHMPHPKPDSYIIKDCRV